MRLKAWLCSFGKGLAVFFKTLGHLKTPDILDLTAVVEIHFTDEQSISDTRQAGCPCPIGCADVA